MRLKLSMFIPMWFVTEHERKENDEAPWVKMKTHWVQWRYRCFRIRGHVIG